ncbi:hypothetical protein C8R43DRAFT_188338 [Mycena crocata]|nr:hypothetical protein C8R43DRAFT_188338 [Mycena crocata]
MTPSFIITTVRHRSYFPPPEPPEPSDLSGLVLRPTNLGSPCFRDDYGPWRASSPLHSVCYAPRYDVASTFASLSVLRVLARAWCIWAAPKPASRSPTAAHLLSILLLLRLHHARPGPLSYQVFADRHRCLCISRVLVVACARRMAPCTFAHRPAAATRVGDRIQFEFWAAGQAGHEARSPSAEDFQMLVVSGTWITTGTLGYQ